MSSPFQCLPNFRNLIINPFHFLCWVNLLVARSGVILTRWNSHESYIWSRSELSGLALAMADGSSEPFRLSLLSSISDLCDTNIVTEKLDDYISQACKRTFNHVKCKGKYKSKAPKWYGAECRAKERSRSERASGSQHTQIMTDK